MDKGTLLVCDFAKLLVVPTQNYREQITKVCKLQDIALEYGWIVLDRTEHLQKVNLLKATYEWMRHEIQQQMKAIMEDT